MARGEPISQHGWFPDPEDPSRLRMWDGKAWTSLTKYPSAEDVVSTPAPSAPPAPRRPSPQPAQRLDVARLAPSAAASATPPPAPAPSPGLGGLVAHVAAAATATKAPQDPHVEPADATPRTLAAANFASVLTLGLALVCIIAASVSGYAVIAVVPALVALRAYAVRERMAPLAALAAAASVIIGLVLLTK